MSYDMGIGDWDTNYTSNGCRLWYDHMNESEGIKYLYGMTGTEVIDALIDFFDSVETAYGKSGEWPKPMTEWLAEKYSPENGWGNVFSQWLLMSEIMVACKKYPNDIFWIRC